MHAKGEPKTMQDDPRYDDVALEVYDYLDGAHRSGRGGRHRPRPHRRRPRHRLRQDARPQRSRCLPISACCMGSACRSWSAPRASASSAGWRAAKHRSRGRPVPSPWPSSRRRKAHKSCGSTTSPERGRRSPSGGRASPAKTANPLAPWKKGVKPLIHQTELM